ncbi:hypothetical protein D9758_005795 [Tetrapyrgos nigripes]|uniref:Uncharacterized protein n=1 Tax=Tetrapyrgos nigripes TaxID=182062 RepID=A0A8H5GJV9_9AGAR|nr:hypothetical protein D9758_005795 [Tetrapyrgos nigripes]
MSYPYDDRHFSSRRDIPRMDPPSFRHATPSGPWPFLDLEDEVDDSQLSSPPPQPDVDYDHDEYHRRQLEQQQQQQQQQQQKQQQENYNGYPQAQFANWTPVQQQKSGIASVKNKKTALLESCHIYKLDVWEDGTFHADTDKDGDWVVKLVKSGGPGPEEPEEAKKSKEEFWTSLQEPKPGPRVRVRALFVDNLSGPVLEMLGTKFHIEPFFFSSSIKCIPSRYQEQVQPGKGDHITMTLRYIRILQDPSTGSTTRPSSETKHSSSEDTLGTLDPSFYTQEEVIDIQGPLRLRSSPGKILLPDLLSFHIVRRNAHSAMTPAAIPDPVPAHSQPGPSRPPAHHRQPSTFSTASRSSSGVSTIISYHRPSSAPYIMTTAKMLHSRLLAAGRSVYWSNIFKDTVPYGDPNFVALSLLWYAMYSWDEVYELLLREVAWLESQTLTTLPSEADPDKDTHSKIHDYTQQLHHIRAHLLHHESLLSSFRKSVTFLQITRNPAYTGKTGLADSAEIYGNRPLAFETPKRRASSTRHRGLGYGSFGSIGPVPGSGGMGRSGSFSSYGRRNWTAMYDGMRRSSMGAGTGTRARPPSPPPPLTPLGTSEQHVLSESISEEPDSIEFEEEDAFLLMEEAESEEEYREGLLKKECLNLIHEIDRLEMTRDMLDKRLGNVMALAFSSVNIEDSKRMRKLAESSSRDSAVMKQISYLTMVFLPATFVATVFGMNVREINPGSFGTLPHYFEAVIPLTVVTIWIMMLQYQSYRPQHSRPQDHKVLTPSTFLQVAPTTYIRKSWNWLVWPLTLFIKELWPWSEECQKGKEARDSRGMGGSIIATVANAARSLRSKASVGSGTAGAGKETESAGRSGENPARAA